MEPFDFEAIAIGCAGKVKHNTYDEAARRLRLQRKSGRNGLAMKPYRCDDCGGWHVGGGHPRRFVDHKRKSG